MFTFFDKSKVIDQNFFLLLSPYDPLIFFVKALESTLRAPLKRSFSVLFCQYVLIKSYLARNISIFLNTFSLCVIQVIQVKSTRGVLLEKSVLKHFAIFTGKHMRWSIFLIKLQT